MARLRIILTDGTIINVGFSWGNWSVQCDGKEVIWKDAISDDKTYRLINRVVLATKNDI